MHKPLFKSKGQYTVKGKLWIEYEGDRCFGPGRMELLTLIGRTGSINKAAKEMGMSYKKAWTMINNLNGQMNEPIVIRQTGGENGGGSVLSEAAKRLMLYHVSMQERFKKFIEQEELIIAEY